MPAIQRGGIRDIYWERQPSWQVMEAELNGIAPHAQVMRVSFNAVAGQYIIVQSAFIGFIRLTAGGTPGKASMWVMANSGGSNASIQRIRMISNNVGDGVNAHHGLDGPFYIPVGGQISIWTEDTSVGGTVDYFGSAFILRIDEP
jgi:hypothetical protein